ncbi:glycine-rich domain-containing protein [Aurantiacibacter hainanensis]|uniref:glycine-rich domain-containing protein n=1 Tax=Aurantiacibacter hainanensis TaxID=3076114 RepID=UPI0030C721CD
MDRELSRKAELDALRARLFTYRIGPETAVLSFRNRLARENRWTPGYAQRVIHEYYRFCFLAVTAGHEVTPSDQVDQAWHLHLTYSRDYWQRFCPEVLGTSLHHGPTAGGRDERDRYYEQYALTMKSYQETFGEAPPADIWSPPVERFGDHPRAFRIRPSQVMFLKDAGGIVRLFFALVVTLGIGIALGLMWGG